MKRVFLHIIYIYSSIVAFAMMMALGSCDRETSVPTDPDAPDPAKIGQPGVTLDNTHIVYMAGENSLARFVDADSLEIAEGATRLPDGARVVVFIDDARSSRICVGTNKEPLQTVRLFPRNITATDSAEMVGVLNEIFTTYPARHYGLTFWSHASGWVEHAQASRVRRRSYGIDNGVRDRYSNDGREMDITTLAGVLAHVPHTDYILFDACFMQCVEVAYELRNATDYVISSPAEIPGDGAPYQLMLPLMCAATPDINAILRTYYDYYNEGDGHSTYHGVVISAVRTDRLDALAAATRPHVMGLYGDRREATLDDVLRYCPRDDSDYYTEYFDMASLMYRNLTPDAYAQWRAVFDAAVPYVYARGEWYTALQSDHIMTVDDPDHAGGVSMFTPGLRYDDDRQWNTAYHSTAWYRAAGFDQTGW